MTTAAKSERTACYLLVKKFFYSNKISMGTRMSSSQLLTKWLGFPLLALFLHLEVVLLLFPAANGFLIQTSPPSPLPLSTLSWNSGRTNHYLQLTQILDYEYIPNDDNNNEGAGSHEYTTNLPSVYPEGTPAGLRGEAVRAALQSEQCLAWEYSLHDSAATRSANLASGVLQLTGPGVLDFLNNKLSNLFRVQQNLSSSTTASSEETLDYKQACLLTPKGRLVDVLSIAYCHEKAWIVPSPGHAASSLFSKLDPFIFPMDQVKLTNLVENAFLFTLASTRLNHVQTVVNQQFLPRLNQQSVRLGPTNAVSIDRLDLPLNKNKSTMVQLDQNQNDDGPSLLVMPLTGLPECAVQGYTFIFLNDNHNIGKDIWQYLVGDDNAKGPIEIRGLEYESLRIQAGQAAFGFEVTGAWKTPELGMTSPTPLELHLQRDIIDLDKGCYLGQEGIASVVKNPRGPPRTLYSVVFEDDHNIYQHQTKGDKSNFENLTKLPKPGDKLYVLGSNEQIEVGTLTSVAEPYSTGDPTIFALALIRRADSVLKQMKSQNLQISRQMANQLAGSTRSSGGNGVSGDTNSGIIYPPPMDSLDGLEVIVGGTFTVGHLRSVPSRRFPKGKNMFQDQEQVFLSREEILDQGYVDIEYSGMSPAEFLEELMDQSESKNDNVPGIIEEDEGLALDGIIKEGSATVDDDAAEAEAEVKRKSRKMELLKQRAEEAMARRKQKKLEATMNNADMNKMEESEDAKAAKAKRKEEKMKLLQKQAEEAIARRRKKKEQQG